MENISHPNCYQYSLNLPQILRADVVCILQDGIPSVLGKTLKRVLSFKTPLHHGQAHASCWHMMRHPGRVPATASPSVLTDYSLTLVYLRTPRDSKFWVCLKVDSVDLEQNPGTAHLSSQVRSIQVSWLSALFQKVWKPVPRIKHRTRLCVVVQTQGPTGRNDQSSTKEHGHVPFR